jgi:hypothetical protein
VQKMLSLFGGAYAEFMLTGGHLSKLEHSDVQCWHLSIPLPSDFTSGGVTIVSFNPLLSVLDVGGNVSRSRGLPCMVWQVGSSKGNVVDTICLRNDE